MGVSGDPGFGKIPFGYVMLAGVVLALLAAICVSAIVFFVSAMFSCLSG